MSLERFIGSRLVILSPTTRIYDAVRAMLDNRIGAVLVHDGKALVGIVTDRDLGLQTLVDDLDAYDFQLSEVMSAPVISLSADAALTDVTDLMIRERVRRIPLLDGGAVAGLVTLDDLILERLADANTLAAILRAQLSQPARLKPAGQLHPTRPENTEALNRRAEQRQQAHQRQAYARLLRRTLAFTELAWTERAEAVLQLVLSGLLRRVTREEARHLLAQLPSRLRLALAPRLPAEPDLGVNRQSIESDLQRQLLIGPDLAAQLLDQVGRALQASISEGEICDFTSQLPADMKGILAG
jgi:CBS domain-containing protein/uncharacterized protein (DUF2267 family)